MARYLNRLKQKYKKRILSANPAGLVLIELEIALSFIENNDLTRARRAVCQLAESLDFRYGLSQHLYNIYAIIEKKLTAGIVNNDQPAVSDAKNLILLLLDKWRDTAADTACSEPVITQTKADVYLGLTYNAAGLCEYAKQDYSGGYKA